MHMKLSGKMLLLKISSVPVNFPPLSLNHTANAERDSRRLCHHVLTTGKRKSAPEHSVPTEVVGMMLKPSWKLQEQSNVALFGLGMSREPSIDAPHTWRAFVRGYQLIKRSGNTPLK